jgi:hypothetical protein
LVLLLDALETEMFRFAVDSITFNDGTVVEVPEEGVLVLVGPNNSGKSAALRDILRHIQQPPGAQPPPIVVLALRVKTEGSVNDLETWLSQHAFSVDRPDGRYFHRPQADARWENLQAEWQGQQSYKPLLNPFIVFFAAADQRLGLLADAGVYDPTSQAPDAPIQVLFARPELEKALSDIAYEAFGVHVTVSKIWGGGHQLLMGQVDEQPTIPASQAYVEAVRALPPLAQQGDGVRSFMGLMLALTTAQFPVIIMDEPEAFLHPPQARLLGRKLATEAPSRTQVFVATHDSDVLQGLLATSEVSVTVARLVRDGTINRVAVLESSKLRALWRDPLLRYSNVLQGLFHRGVVVSEADTDSRYYAAVLDATRERESLPPHDLLFTQSGGKQRLPTVLRALHAVAVPVALVADFDVLRGEALLKEIVQELGGQWAHLATDWRAVTATIEQGGSAPSITVVREQILKVLDQATDATLTPDQASEIRQITRVDDAWRRAKQAGLSIVPQGEPSQRATRLIDALASLGLFVVTVGEIERWAPDIPGHGPAWVGAAIEQRRHEDPRSGAATFVESVAAFFAEAVPPS